MNLCYRIACVNNLYMKYVKSILNAYVIPLLIFFFSDWTHKIYNPFFKKYVCITFGDISLQLETTC